LFGKPNAINLLFGDDFYHIYGNIGDGLGLGRLGLPDDVVDPYPMLFQLVASGWDFVSFAN
jgi:hypothetical protein